MRVTRPLVDRGLVAYGGMDLSSHLDLTGFAAAIPFEKKIHLDVYAWIPEDAFEVRETANRDRFRMWRDLGWLTVHPGAVIDYDLLLADLKQIKTQYKLKAVAFDPWGLESPAQTLTKCGFKIVDFRQGEKTISPAVKDFEAAVYSGKLKHYGNPILSWCIENVRMEKGPAGGFKPSKRHSTGKIDPLMASIMAVAMAEQGKHGPKTSVYSTREMLMG